MNIVQLIISVAAVILTGFILPGVEVKLIASIIVAIVLTLANIFATAPLMALLGLPMTVIAIALFTLVMDAIIVLILSAILPGFKVKSFWTALIFSLILTIVTAVLNYFF